jgi:predicted metal-dependent phosphoesterase TrpH
VPPDGIPADVRSRPAVPPGWQRVDLHNHTHRSYDAVLRLEHYERAHAAGRLDVLAITDHNRVDGARELAEDASFPVIVGEEIDTAEGELIGLFLTERIPPGLAIAETASRIRAQGGLVYLQHPFYRLVHRPLGAATVDLLADAGLVDVVEVVNGGPFTETANRRALEWARARGLPVASSSDAHDPPDVARCVTAIPPGPVEPASLLARLAEGVLVDERRASLAVVATKVRSRTVDALSSLIRQRHVKRRR